MTVSNRMLALLSEGYQRTSKEKRDYRDALRGFVEFVSDRDTYFDEAAQDLDALAKEVDAFSKKVLSKLSALEDKAYEVNGRRADVVRDLENIYPSNDEPENDPAVKIVDNLLQRNAGFKANIPAEVLDMKSTEIKAAMAQVKTALVSMKKPLADRRPQLDTDKLVDIHDDLEELVDGY